MKKFRTAIEIETAKNSIFNSMYKNDYSIFDIYMRNGYGEDDDYFDDTIFYYFTFKSEESASDFLKDINMDIDIEEYNINDDDKIEVESNNQIVGRFNNSFLIVRIENKRYVLNEGEWDGEQYYDCWQVADKKGLYKVGDDKFRIKPLYKEIDEDEFVIVDYEIISY